MILGKNIKTRVTTHPRFLIRVGYCVTNFVAKSTLDIIDNIQPYYENIKGATAR